MDTSHAAQATHGIAHTLVSEAVLWQRCVLDVLEVVNHHQIKALLGRQLRHRGLNEVDVHTVLVSADDLDVTVAVAEVTEVLHEPFQLTTIAVALDILVEDADVVVNAKQAQLNLLHSHLGGDEQHPCLWIMSQHAIAAVHAEPALTDTGVTSKDRHAFTVEAHDVLIKHTVAGGDEVVVRELRVSTL